MLVENILVSVMSSYSEVLGISMIGKYEEHPGYSHGVDAWARAWMV